MIRNFGRNFVHFIMIDWDHWIKKRVNYLSCIEGKPRVYFIIWRGNCFLIIKSILVSLITYNHNFMVTNVQFKSIFKKLCCSTLRKLILWTEMAQWYLARKKIARKIFKCVYLSLFIITKLFLKSESLLFKLN